MKVQVLKMLELQDAMNSKVNPEWIHAGNAWWRAIWLECAETVEHNPWKWWKKGGESDIPKTQIEAVDIWHFGLSILIEGAKRGEVTSTMDELADKVVESWEICGNLEIAPEDITIIKTAESLAAAALNNHAFNLGAFYYLLKACHMTFDDLYKMYVGKNVLNFFRQDHGYKDGSYVKIWDGREDNDHLNEIMDALDISSATYDKDVYSALAARYAIHSQTAYVTVCKFHVD